MIYKELVASLFEFKIYMYSCVKFIFLAELSTAKSPEVIAACEEIP